MRLALALGLATCAVAFAAAAQPADHPDHPVQQRVFINGGPMGHMMEMGDIDANHDGWLSRDEAAAAADHMFAHLDGNHDGKLDQSDHPEVTHFELQRGGGDGDTVIRMGDGHDVHVEHGDNVHVETGGDGATRTIIITRDGDGHGDVHVEGAPTPPPAGHGDNNVRTEERTVTIVRNGDGPDHSGPHGPPEMHMMHGPMMAMMLFANSEEADVNGDGAISQEEFRNQQLRFFDASDVNRDGKIRFHTPPTPPAPPAPPPPPPPRH